MNMNANQPFDERIREAAHQFQYPPTPEVTEAVWKRLHSGSRPKARLRSAWVVMSLLLVALAVLFTVPSARAEIIRFFQVGVVRIFPPSPTLTAEPSMPALPMTATPVTATPDLFTPNPGVNMPFYTITTLGLAGETSLAEAQAKLPFPILLPAYPANLGEPERVFLQEDGGMILLLWTDPADTESVRLSLHEIAPGKVVMIKYGPHVILETQVNGVRAVWAQGPYLIQLTNGTYDYRRMVEGNTLIWEQEGITYRLESDLTLEETIRIAESLR